MRCTEETRGTLRLCLTSKSWKCGRRHTPCHCAYTASQHVFAAPSTPRSEVSCSSRRCQSQRISWRDGVIKARGNSRASWVMHSTLARSWSTT